MHNQNYHVAGWKHVGWFSVDGSVTSARRWQSSLDLLFDRDNCRVTGEHLSVLSLASSGSRCCPVAVQSANVQHDEVQFSGTSWLHVGRCGISMSSDCVKFWKSRESHGRLEVLEAKASLCDNSWSSLTERIGRLWAEALASVTDTHAIYTLSDALHITLHITHHDLLIT